MKNLYNIFLLGILLSTVLYADSQRIINHKYISAINQHKYKEAMSYVKQAMNSNNKKEVAWANNELGSIYLNAWGVERDCLKAKKYFEIASSLNNIGSKTALASLLIGDRSCKDIPVNYKRGIKYYIEASKNGSAMALHKLGFMNENGKYNTPVNYKKAIEYYKQSIKEGDYFGFSSLRLGFMYLEGIGVKQDYKKASYYFELTVKSKGFYMPIDLATLYYTIDSIKNYKKAKKYFEEDNSSLSKNNIGVMYFRGHGVVKDYTKAKDIFKNEYTLHHTPEAINNLAWMYFHGYGVKQDILHALVLFQTAASANSITASLNLAWIYKNGYGTEINLDHFHFYQEKAKKLKIKFPKKIDFQLSYLLDTSSFIDDITQKLNHIKQVKVSKTRFLIVIGAEHYEYTDNIVYSQHTAKMFTKVAQKILGISKSNTLELTNKNASMGRIQMKMKKLLRRVKKGDTVYFYYSGHGIPVVSQKNEPYILPIDVEPEFISEAPFFELKNIYKTLTNSKASKVVAFIDSCFSGATDGVSVIKGVAATRLKPKNVSFDKKKMVILTAGKDKQYSNMYEEKGYRLFSYFLMESMLKGRSSIKDIYSDVYIHVKDKSYEMGDMKLQEPTIMGNKKLKL